MSVQYNCLPLERHKHRGDCKVSENVVEIVTMGVVIHILLHCWALECELVLQLVL